MPNVDELFPEQGRSIDSLFPVEVERERNRQRQFNTSPVQDLIFGDTSVNPVARVLDAFGQGARHAWGSHNDTVSKESEEFLKASKQYDEWIAGQTGITKAAHDVLFRPAASQLYREFKDAQAIFHGIGAGIEGTKAAIAQIGVEAGQEKLGKEVAAGFEAFPTGFRQPAGTFPRMHPADYIKEVERAKDLKTVGAGEAGYQGTAEVTAPAPTETILSIRGTDYSGAMEAGKPATEGAINWKERLGLGAMTEDQLKSFITDSKQHVSNFELTINDPLDSTRHGKDTLDHYAEQARIGREGIAAAEEELAGRATEQPARVTSAPINAEHPIAQDVTARLVKAGRLAEEASASGQVIASHYESRAARFGGALGTAEELYKNEGAEIRGPGGKSTDAMAEPAPTNSGPRGRAAADPQSWSLHEFLASEGGLKPTADLRAIFGGKNPFIPGFGPLLRKGGMTMDEALTRAKENSYVLDPNDIQHTPDVTNAPRGEKTVRWQDLQDMVAEEAGGKKQFRNTREEPAAKINLEEEAGHIKDALYREVEASGGSVRDIDPVTADRVVELMQGGKAKDVMGAYEQAIMEFEYNQIKRGHIRLKDGEVKPIITLLKDANESTFIHETGHHWLEELMRDAKHEKAPTDLIADSKAVLDWLGVKPEKAPPPKPGMIRFYHGTAYDDASGFTGKTFVTPHEQYARDYRGGSNNVLYTDMSKAEAIQRGLYDEINGYPQHGPIDDGAARLKPLERGGEIKTRHHEQFARGFERYMMEGVAPSRELASVFAKFREWLTRIYETVTRLKSPINDEIRGVFDRLIAQDPERIRIEPEAPKAFSEIHEADALHTPPEASRPVAETIRAERDRLAAEQFPEENDARLEGVASGTGRREAGGAQPLRDRNATEPGPQEAGRDQAPGAVGEGGNNAPAEGAGASAQPRTEVPVSAGEPFKPTESPLMDKAGNIRLENLNTTDDVKQVIRDSAERNNDFIEARRGVVTDGDALRLSEAMGLTVEDVAARKIGEAWNKEQIFALEKLFIQASTAVRDAMKAGDELAYAETVARFQMIQQTVQSHASGVRAEAGRALQAFAALKKIEGGAAAHQLGDLLQQHTGKTLFQLQREMKLGQLLETPADVAKFVTEARKPTWSDKLVELWMSFLLSGPKTQVANALGNSIVSIMRPIETATAAGIGKVRNLITGSEDRVHFAEASAELFGMVQGSKEGVVAAYKAFKTEEPQLTAVNQIERGHQRAMGSWNVNLFGHEMEIGGKQLRLPLRMMGATDEFFKGIAFRGDINRQAVAIAAKEGLAAEQFNARVAELSKNPTDEMAASAKAVADYQTFQNPLGKAGRAIQGVSNAHPLFKIVLPFVRTPLNLLKYAAERTPLGVWSAEVRDNLAGRNGAAARDTQIARMAIGTMVGVATLEMASQGLVTGGGPNDPKEKAILKMTGWQEYSVKVGDHYYSYRRLDPFSTILGVVADAYELSHQMSRAEAEKHNIPALLFGSISKTLLDKASLKGASDLIQAATQFERFGNGYIKNLAGTVVPAFSAQTAQAIDPIVRETRTVLDNLKARTPYLSKDLHPRRDVWGNEVVREGGLGPDVASPIALSRLKNDPVNKALLDARYFPSKLDRKIRGVELDDQQYDDYTRIAGRTAKMRLNTIVQMPGFERMPEAVRKDLMTKAITTSREMARSLILMQSPEIIRKANDAKMATMKAN